MSSSFVNRWLRTHQSFWAALAGAVLGTAAAALIYFFLLERRIVADALFLRDVVPRAFERTLIDVVVVSKTTAVGALPCLLFAALQARGRQVTAMIVYVTALWLCFFFLNVDLRVYLLHGRHLLEILAYAALPEGHQAGGDPVLWAWRFFSWAVQALGLAVCGAAVALGVTAGLSRLRSRLIRATLAVPLASCAFAAAPVAASPGAGWVTPGLQNRLLGVLPVSLGVQHTGNLNHLSDPLQRQLQVELSEVYHRKFGYVFRKRENAAHDQGRLRARPNVFLILVESLRADALTEELMPQVFAWSRAGLRRTRHMAGTNFSESGAFTILYGLNPLVYHAVLDAGVRPPLCEGLRALSYQCAYYTGHPTVWWRREEFLGPSTFDVHQRFQQGSWSDWDQSTLKAFAEFAAHAREGGHLGIAFLMSTHYEYRYPAAFERFVPAKEPDVSWSGARAKGDFTSLANRYKNALGFVDHLIGQALRSIDTRRDYVMITGDHAEALGENGKVGHGHDFSDTLLHVPFVLRGPGITAGEVEGLSLHQDIWPTVASLVTGTEPSEHDMRRPSHRRGGLWSHCQFDQQEADALLVHDGARLRLTLNLKAPELRVQGFEDAQGRPVPTPRLSDEQARELIESFGRYLDDAARPIYTVPEVIERDSLVVLPAPRR